jgi:putative phage-type endonuclease
MAKERYQGSSDWHAERRGIIGSSDAPRLVGVSRFGGPLDVYLDKTSDEPSGPDSPDREKAKAWGHRLEDTVARAWAEVEGLRVHRVERLVRHPQFSFLGASLDRAVVKCPDGRCVLEVKTRRALRGWGESGTATVPDDVYVQVQHQLLVTGWGHAHVVVLVGGSDLRSYLIPRDAQFLEDYALLASTFWHEHVVPRVPPAWDGSETGDRLLERMYPATRGREVAATAEVDLIVGQLVDVRRQLAEISQQESILVQRVKDWMKDATRLVGPGYTIRYGQSAPAKVVAWQLVAAAYRKTLEEVAPDRVPDLEAVVSLYTKEAKAARPFVLDVTDEED